MKNTFQEGGTLVSKSIRVGRIGKRGKVQKALLKSTDKKNRSFNKKVTFQWARLGHNDKKIFGKGRKFNRVAES